MCLNDRKIFREVLSYWRYIDVCVCARVRACVCVCVGAQALFSLGILNLVWFNLKDGKQTFVLVSTALEKSTAK